MTTKYDSTTYDLYVALFNARQKRPEIWTDIECNRVLTAVMSAKRWSWHVVGITPAAMETFAEDGFRRKARQGLTRAHLWSRIDTVRELLSSDTPLDVEAFIEMWVENDRTILCSRGENKHGHFPSYIKIPNHNAELFNCEGVLAGWRHGKKEVDFLRKLYKRKGSWSLTTRVPDMKTATRNRSGGTLHNRVIAILSAEAPKPVPITKICKVLYGDTKISAHSSALDGVFRGLKRDFSSFRKEGKGRAATWTL